MGSNPAQRLRQRHIYSGAASRRVSGVTETNQGCWPARRGSCSPPRAEGTKGGNRASRACETWGGEDAASWYLPLAQPSGGVLSGGVQGRAERRIPREGEKPWVRCHQRAEEFTCCCFYSAGILSGAGAKPGTMQRTEWVKVYPAGVAPGDGASSVLLAGTAEVCGRSPARPHVPGSISSNKHIPI